MRWADSLRRWHTTNTSVARSSAKRVLRKINEQSIAPLETRDWSGLPCTPVVVPIVPFYKRLEDALSVPRLRSLLQALRSVARAPDRMAAFRGVFLQAGGEEYRCPDGTAARDFDVVRRGYCVGYRYDGSWTFYDQQHLSAARAGMLAQAAAAPSSKYAEWLLKSGGIPNPVYLQRFSLFRPRRAQGWRQSDLLPAGADPGHARRSFSRRRG